MTLAVVMAAGTGTRMRPLSANVPKPLLRLHGVSLLLRHLNALDAHGFDRAVVTSSYQSQTLRLIASHWKFTRLQIEFSHEGDTPLETAGGLRRVIARSSGEPITVINGDIWTDFPLAHLADPPEGGMHVLLVDNPPHHPDGDFRLLPSGLVAPRDADSESLTFCGISRIDPEALRVASHAPRLASVLHELIRRGLLSGQRCAHRWHDVGRPSTLLSLNRT